MTLYDIKLRLLIVYLLFHNNGQWLLHTLCRCALHHLASFDCYWLRISTHHFCRFDSWHQGPRAPQHLGRVECGQWRLHQCGVQNSHQWSEEWSRVSPRLHLQPALTAKWVWLATTGDLQRSCTNHTKKRHTFSSEYIVLTCNFCSWCKNIAISSILYLIPWCWQGRSQCVPCTVDHGTSNDIQTYTTVEAYRGNWLVSSGYFSMPRLASSINCS